MQISFLFLFLLARKIRIASEARASDYHLKAILMSLWNWNLRGAFLQSWQVIFSGIELDESSASKFCLLSSLSHSLLGFGVLRRCSEEFFLGKLAPLWTFSFWQSFWNNSRKWNKYNSLLVSTFEWQHRLNINDFVFWQMNSIELTFLRRTHLFVLNKILLS